MLSCRKDDRMSLTLDKKVDYQCIACKRDRVFPGEGRIIDGSWTDDAKVAKHRGRWVCGVFCYMDLIKAEALRIDSK